MYFWDYKNETQLVFHQLKQLFARAFMLQLDIFVHVEAFLFSSETVPVQLKTEPSLVSYVGLPSVFCWWGQESGLEWGAELGPPLARRAAPRGQPDMSLASALCFSVHWVCSQHLFGGVHPPPCTSNAHPQLWVWGPSDCSLPPLNSLPSCAHGFLPDVHPFLQRIILLLTSDIKKPVNVRSHHTCSAYSWHWFW